MIKNLIEHPKFVMYLVMYYIELFRLVIFQILNLFLLLPLTNLCPVDTQISKVHYQVIKFNY